MLVREVFGARWYKISQRLLKHQWDQTELHKPPGAGNSPVNLNAHSTEAMAKPKVKGAVPSWLLSSCNRQLAFVGDVLGIWVFLLLTDII